MLCCGEPGWIDSRPFRLIARERTSTLMPLLIPASVGELIDKITILEIKQQRIADAAKQLNISRELQALMAVVEQQKSRKRFNPYRLIRSIHLSRLLGERHTLGKTMFTSFLHRFHSQRGMPVAVSQL